MQIPEFQIKMNREGILWTESETAIKKFFEMQQERERFFSSSSLARVINFYTDEEPTKVLEITVEVKKRNKKTPTQQIDAYIEIMYETMEGCTRIKFFKDEYDNRMKSRKDTLYARTMCRIDSYNKRKEMKKAV